MLVLVEDAAEAVVSAYVESGESAGFGDRWCCPASVMVSMKSMAGRALAWDRRKLAQVVVARSGAGSMPCVRRISQTVDDATLARLDLILAA